MRRRRPIGGGDAILCRMRIAVSADERTGVADAVVDELRRRGHEPLVHGALSDDERPDWAWASRGARRATSPTGRAEQAIVCCWTGTGASIAANKVAGVRAALCGDATTAEGARRWNDANVLALSLRSTSQAELERDPRRLVRRRAQRRPGRPRQHRPPRRDLTAEVHAAGGLVVRDGRVLLEHRPRYDDWSLPKGKLEPGEDSEQAAVREVMEETGVRVRLGEELEPVHYTDNKGRREDGPLLVMTPVGDDEFAPNDEVDEIVWLAPEAAIERLSYPHDRDLVTRWSRRGLEVERKSLVDRLPGDLDRAPRRRLSQGYLVTGDVEVRLRRADDETFLTVKAGRGLVRAEEELPIDPDRFDRLWPLTEGRRVEKVRHLVEQDGRTIEIDVYAGAHEGLVVAEVEFPDEDGARAWTPPPWLGADVTGDPSYSNARLAS